MKYHGSVGYAVAKESADIPDTFENSIEEHIYQGDIISNRSQWKETDKINDDLTISNKISILADPYAFQNFQHIRYVTWMNSKWKVSNIELAFPRIILTINGEWNNEDKS